MAKTKGKKNIVLTKENLLYQPLSLAVSGYNATAFQQNIVIGVLRKLKSALVQAKDGQFSAPPIQLSLFENPDTAIYRRSEDEMKIGIHLRELGVEPNNYGKAFDQIKELGRIMAWVPEIQPDGSTHLRMETVFGLELDEKDVEKDSNGQVIALKKKRSPVVYINIKKKVADFVFNPKSRIYDFIDDTAMMIKDKYPKRLYMYLSNHKYLEEGLTIGYWKFRQQIGFDDRNKDKIMYPQFYDFKKKVLDCSLNVLKDLADKDLSDFWFEWEPIYKGSKKAKAPDELHFTFHLSNVGQSIKDDKSYPPRIKEIEKRLREELEQTAAQTSRIITSLRPQWIDLMEAKLEDLTEYMSKNNIENKRAYVSKSVNEFLKELASSADVSEKEETEVEVIQAEPLPSIDNEHMAEWGRALECIDPDWRSVFELVEWGSVVKVQMPTKASYDSFVGIFGESKIDELAKRVGERLVFVFKDRF